MSTRYVNIDRETPMFLPCDLREWVSEDDLVHFVIAAVEEVDLGSFQVNARGTGSEQYPPQMMLALLIYSYANGVFSSRRIERMTYSHVAFRYLCANRHPDHDTIAKFRRENFAAVSECFLRVLEMAREMKLLKVGTVSVDGTHMAASASKYKNISHGRAVELEKRLEQDIAELLSKAEAADRSVAEPPDKLPAELARREHLREKIKAAREELERRAREKAEVERADYEAKVARREARSKHKGRNIKPPSDQPKPGDQANMTDHDSRLMRKSSSSPCTQSYNAQITVDADGSCLILSGHICQSSSDANELERGVRGVPASVGRPERVLADNGYMNGDQIKSLATDGHDVYVAPKAGDMARNMRYDFRPEPKRKARKKPGRKYIQAWLVAMAEKVSSEAGRKIYSLRKQTVEPVFGIIKDAMGFRRFNLRGLEKVAGEWNLVTLAYNVRRLWKMAAA